MSAGARKYDESKRQEAQLAERYMRQEKERILQEHQVRRTRYLNYLEQRKQARRLRWWQKLFLVGLSCCFLFCLTMLLSTFSAGGKIWVHDLLFRVLSTPAI